MMFTIFLAYTGCFIIDTTSDESSTKSVVKHSDGLLHSFSAISISLISLETKLKTQFDKLSGVFRGEGAGGGRPPPGFSESCLKEKSLRGQIFVQRIHQYWIYYSNYIVLYVYYFFIMKKFEKNAFLDALVLLSLILVDSP